MTMRQVEQRNKNVFTIRVNYGIERNASVKRPVCFMSHCYLSGMLYCFNLAINRDVYVRFHYVQNRQ